MITVREARPSDAVEMATIFQSRLDPTLLALSAFGCQGLHRLMHKEIQGINSDFPTCYFVAADPVSDAILACCQIRLLGGAAFLNAIAVAQQVEGLGVARSLLFFALKNRRLCKVPLMQLDVNYSNQRAYQWYRRLGFEACGEIGWYHAATVNCGCPAYLLLGYTQAAAANSRDGFGRFAIQINNHRHDVGILRDQWFRVWSKHSALDSHLDAVLHRLDPQRRKLFYDSHAGFAQHCRRPWTVECTMSRLTIPMDVLSATLACPSSGQILLR